MSRRRRWVARSAHIVLRLFLLATLLPRAGIYAHHHPGGELAHVHAWGADVEQHGAHGQPHATHVHRRVAADGHGVGLTAAGDDSRDHVHWQLPFHSLPAPTRRA